MKKISKILTGFWIISALIAVFPAVASANGSLTIVVKNPNPYTGNQSWFTYEKKPGEVIDDVATVKNLSNKPLRAHVYAVDATSNDSGNFILKLENEDKTGIGKWTKLTSSDIITIPAQQSMDFPFHIEVPANLTPGQYFGGLVLEEVGDNVQPVAVAAAADNGKKICCTNILVKTRIGLRIYLTIPGTIVDKMEWSGFKTIQKNKTTNFQFEIKNTGNVALEPVATIEIFDQGGKQVDRFEKTLGESLPGTIINPVIGWENQALFGSFRAIGKVHYRIKNQSIDQKLHGSSEKGETKVTEFNIVPWKMLYGIILVILAAGIGYWIYARNQQQLKTQWETYEVQAYDNIMSIAESHSVDWKKLARVNKLKPPYLVKKGEIIRVPKTVRHNQTTLFDVKDHE
ncbi:MAG: DUF916 domain-containing protein [Candidatus Gracilibacteria bacterium]